MYLIDITPKMISKYRHLTQKMLSDSQNKPSLRIINNNTNNWAIFTFPNDSYLQDLNKAIQYIAIHLMDKESVDGGERVVFRIKNGNEWVLGSNGRYKDEN